MVKFNYYAHSCFSLSDGKTTLLFDPFFSGNPLNKTSAESVECDYILVTHAHGDHLGDAIEIAKRTGATIISVPEITNLDADVNGHGMNIGGSYKFPFGTVRMVMAQHSFGMAAGLSCGFVVELGGMTFYFAGDTGLFSDMKLIPERYSIDCAIVPIGGNFTMDTIDAAKAVEYVDAKEVIPVHYNTWGVIAADPAEFEALVEKAGKAVVHIIEPGNCYKFGNKM